MWKENPDLLCGLNPTEHWHGNVENNQIRAQLPRFLDSFLSVFCLGAHLDVLGLEHRAKAEPYHFMVVRNQHTQRPGAWDGLNRLQIGRIYTRFNRRSRRLGRLSHRISKLD